MRQDSLDRLRQQASQGDASAAMQLFKHAQRTNDHDLMIDLLHEHLYEVVEGYREQAPGRARPFFAMDSILHGEDISTSHGVLRSCVLLSPGTFTMGSPDGETGRYEDEGPQHTVTIDQPFLIMRTPVTQALWNTVTPENPSRFKGDLRPVESVSWFDAVWFCNQLSDRDGLQRAYRFSDREGEPCTEDFSMTVEFLGLDRSGWRLPTEMEWEYACRAGTTTAFNNGEDCTAPDGKDPALDQVGWYEENSGGRTHPVAQKKPNAWGLHDMHGNIWEWCNCNAYRDYTSEDQRNISDQTGVQTGPHAYRMVRGGSWDGDARGARAAYRFFCHPSRSSILGLRLVRSAGR